MPSLSLELQQTFPDFTVYFLNEVRLFLMVSTVYQYLFVATTKLFQC